jgi:hypothetical protein
MPQTDRFVTAFAAEPPQDELPYGRWADRLRVEFLAACLRLDDEGEDLGEAGDIVWYPDRTYGGRTYVPVTSRTTTSYELYGHVSFVPGVDGGEPTELDATAEFTAEVAEENPGWKLDLCEDVIGQWRGEHGKVAQMTLVWGQPLTRGGKVVTAELAGLAVDQCTLVDGRFTLIAPDDYRGDVLDIKLWGTAKRELASESLYEDDEDDEDAAPPSAGAGEAA